MLLQENIPLAPLTTFRIGGPAYFFVEAKSRTEVQEAVAFSRSRNQPLFLLGGGSNLLVSDSGFPGLVLKIAIPGIEQRPGTNDEGKVRFDVGAGESWDRFVSHAVRAECAGVECLSGIPGSVGGTPVQNVGAYGEEASQTIESVEVFDRKDGQIRELCREACGFAYRSSTFNTTERGRFIILRVIYALTPGGEPRVAYADLQRHFAGRETRPNLAETREAVRHIRALKGMLITPGDPDSQSAGSFFKNPVLSREQHEDLEKRAATRGLTIPAYPGLEKSRKVSAAWLVEHSGFSRGYGSGHVGISSKHALAIINRGAATAAEVLALKDQIQLRVEEIWGVALEPEPVMVGF
ncbi:UDP-N-acetylenolpyruvoylglucosamine reductase [Candidatus Sulfotelmatobacter kueseliae]|uniref:UDP-N-acetylenolpyruvoylglucosamine reductase n=1 Tax=Candidatus Sulfotelmatobacter kueseliae TaxID=2042962 RepID=A0A2U3JZ43_9BACT|nr:UDP-N-acetylenolpyruvoylglucosamine reductase [Candidatus Sulfotelmatobacter kueseliae]